MSGQILRKRIFLGQIFLVLAFTSMMVGARAQGPSLGKIMFVGNSFVQGYYPEMSQLGGYRSAAESEILANGASFSFVGRNSENSEPGPNIAHNGFGALLAPELTGGVIRENQDFGTLADWMVEDNPDSVIIDLGRGYPYEGSLSDFVLETRSVLETVFSANPSASVIWLEQVDPLPAFYPVESARLDELNSALENEALLQTSQGRKVTFLALPSWNTMTMLSSDGVHPNGVGQQYIGMQIAGRLMNNAVPEPGVSAALAGLGIWLFNRKRRARA